MGGELEGSPWGDLEEEGGALGSGDEVGFAGAVRGAAAPAARREGGLQRRRDGGGLRREGAAPSGRGVLGVGSYLAFAKEACLEQQALVAVSATVGSQRV